jgi:CHAT domain-containing protein/tetratricopeptide (TPR) repeat protein
MLRKISLTLIGLGTLLLLPLLAQQKPPNHTVSDIEKAIQENEYIKADSLLNNSATYFISQKNYDTLLHLIPLAGKIANGKQGADKAAAAVMSFIDQIKNKTSNPRLLLGAYREAAEYLGGIFQNQQGYKASEEALKYAYQVNEKDSLEIAKSEYNLGVYAHRLGNISLSQTHHRRAFNIRESSPNTKPEDIYFSANAMGTIMWYASKYDSAALFYNKALAALEKLPADDLNKYYRSANIQNNLAAVYNANGKTSDAIAAMQKTIENYQCFIAAKEPHPKKEDAIVGLYEAIDNLAGVYKSIGDYNKAGDLLFYSYNQKKSRFPPGNTETNLSEILIGQYYNSINEYDKALQYLIDGLAKLENAEDDYLIWQADAAYAIALAYANKKEPDKANEYYIISEAFFEEAYQGEYDDVYLDFLRNAALFYAQNKQYEKAIAQATKAYKYLVTVHQEKKLPGFYQLLNMAEVEYLSGRYKEAARYSERALSITKDIIKESNNLLDSAKIEMYKPRAILIHAKAGYQLEPQKNISYLSKLTQQLSEALQILEKRKAIIDDPASINILISENTELIDFAKKIELELYNLTQDDSHLNKLINLHESGLYNRIRSNLDKEKAIRFANLPQEIQDEERLLKAAIPASLQSAKPQSELMNDYLQAVRNWETHLEKVKNSFPAYYNMRYGSIFKDLPELQSSIPANSTLIRYFFVDTSLFALVAGNNYKKLIRLNNNDLTNAITSLLNSNTIGKEEPALLFQLYNKLWQPLEKDIQTDKVIIVPDGILFHLSFEMLTPEPIQLFAELSAKSLLSKYSIAYHYSLFMLDNKFGRTSNRENYIAFVPEFSDNMKKKYTALVKDSVNLDFQYLTLLPQPNTSKLAKKVKSLLHGTLFLNDESTPASFIRNAGGHKIIHIGTHAEYNNNHPERSRLIFAKNTAAANDTNSLYLSDLYNCNIHSDLTILTACESGKPGFQDGEGMISLAHAFNYAGSKNILTGLWKLDEQSSNMITDLFIQNLLKKLPADEALRQAKLQYISQAEGRMKSPVYWAGIVLMGTPEIIDLEHSTNSLPWIIAIASAILLFGVFYIKNNKRKAS